MSEGPSSPAATPASRLDEARRCLAAVHDDLVDLSRRRDTAAIQGGVAEIAAQIRRYLQESGAGEAD